MQVWFFTSEGFYSAVEETKLKRHKGKISVRARESGALELLRASYMPELSATSITPKNRKADYRYRAWIDREQFAEGLARIGRAVDYSNFKSEAARKRGYGRFEKALHDVWNVMARLQPGGPYMMGGKHYPPIPESEGGPGEQTKKTLPKKKGQQTLSLGFMPPDTCDDCGTELEQPDGEWFQGRWLCRNVSGCSDRKWRKIHGAAV